MSAMPQALRRWSLPWLVVMALLAPQPVLAEGFVFQATRAGSAPVYLVGTMHSDDPRVMAALPRVTELIGRVDTVALEIVQEPVGLARAAVATLLPAGEDLFERVGPARRSALERAATQRAVPLPVLARLKPWAAALVLGLPAMAGGQILDSAIQREATRLGRRLVGLEGAVEQLAVFDAMDERLQFALLDAAIDRPHELETQLEQLTRAFLSGDLERLEQVALGRYEGMDPAVESWFRVQLIERRNRRMVERILELAERGPLLVAVGALHLSGETGLVAALDRFGYRIAPVPE